MKLELQRIEATLTQLTEPHPTEPHPPAPESDRRSVATSCSFQIAAIRSPSQPSSEPVALPNSGNPVAPLNLPRFKPISFSSHRHATSPALPLGLLREIEEIVIRWQRELQQVSQQIHALYQQGPIADGWLESQPHPNALEEQNPLSHVEITRLLDSIQELLNVPHADLVTYESPRAGYRFCRLSADGQVHCLPCPPEKVPALSLAIARHQKLRQLLSRQQHLETRLNQLSQSLVALHGNYRKDEG